MRQEATSMEATGLKIIGLTGGIGSGKSTVSGHLAELGYVVIDADRIARAVVEPGSPVLERLAERFGNEILLSDGSLDRGKLAAIVFTDASRREEMDRIMLPEIIGRIQEMVDDYRSKGVDDIIFIDAALLFESGLSRLTDSVWVVHADPAARKRRTAERDGVPVDTVQKRIDAQMSDMERLEKADVILDNNGSIDELFAQVERHLAETANAAPGREA